ncbi:3-methyl-2-oxobutanoate hydroxymethyltransferase [Alphaproteobacteria bacterium]|nr:3-methyl-2-oxobutanoate hydroxymethyltransferase [Alphaproteobacteria bacterium]
MRNRLTVKDLKKLKGNKQLTLILVKNVEEAMAAEKVGIEMLGTGAAGKFTNPHEHPNFDEVLNMRKAAPSTFMHYGAPDTLYPTLDKAKELAFKILEYDFDMFYCHRSTEIVKSLYNEGVPCLGHVGLVPGRTTWIGGYRAVGKTAEEAMSVYDKCLQFQDAGAVAIEMECVPHQVASAISKRVEPTVLSLGSGSGCDVQYLFGCDILLTTTGHIPRHSKSYRNFLEEFERLQKEREEAFQEFYNEVQSGLFPEKKHIVEIEEREYENFMNKLESR